MAKQYNYQDDFEMLFFRHEYLTKLKNPNPQWIEDFKGVIKVTASKMYTKYNINFVRVGLEEDDINSLAQMFTLYYMELYSVRKDQESLEKFVSKFEAMKKRKPTEAEITTSERNNLISFLRQKIKHADVVCSRKARNIIVGRSVGVVLARTADTKKACDEEILSDYKKYGYRKVTQVEFKEAKVRAKDNNSRDLTDLSGYPILVLTKHADVITGDDFSSIMSTSNNIYTNSPEQTLVNYQDGQELGMYKEKFAKMNLKERKRILNRFIRDNRGNRKMKVEMRAAKEMLELAKNVV